jgi:uncharacterized protein (UPF0548 family)
MYRLRRPTAELLRSELDRQCGCAVYQTTAVVADPPPPGFRPNRGRSELGRGRWVFAVAREALRHWEMFPGGWVWVEPEGGPVQLDQTVAVVARCLGMWTVNCCRVVDVTDQPRQFAFTYATTSRHALAGAERFSVTWHEEDDSVWYDVYSIARPRDVRVWGVYPWFRRVQRRFAVESPRALQAAVARRLATSCREPAQESPR